jgi:hypothetical protein
MPYSSCCWRRRSQLRASGHRVRLRGTRGSYSSGRRALPSPPWATIRPASPRRNRGTTRPCLLHHRWTRERCPRFPSATRSAVPVSRSGETNQGPRRNCREPRSFLIPGLRRTALCDPMSERRPSLQLQRRLSAAPRKISTPLILIDRCTALLETIERPEENNSTLADHDCTTITRDATRYTRFVA